MWPQKPTRKIHRILGRMQRWLHSSRAAAITRFVETGSPFLVATVDDRGGRVVSRHRRLTAAKRAAEKHLPKEIRA